MEKQIKTIPWRGDTPCAETLSHLDTLRGFYRSLWLHDEETDARRFIVCQYKEHARSARRAESRGETSESDFHRRRIAEIRWAFPGVVNTLSDRLIYFPTS